MASIRPNASTIMPLSPVKRRAIRLLATATPIREICTKLDVTAHTFRGWRAEPEFQQALDDLIEKHDAIMSENLLEGELEALRVVRDGLGALDQKGEPAWDIRMKAAFRLLDAAGRRGKPAEKSEAVVTTVSQGNEELAMALRDPSVRAWLEKTYGPRQLPAVPLAEIVIEEAEVVG